MSDLRIPAPYVDKTTDTATNHATLDDFRKLTMNRNHNRGSLVASNGGLKCVDHHVFKPLNGFGSVKRDEAIRVRRLFVTAAQSELTARFIRLIDSEAVLHPENVATLREKIKALNQAISDMFLKKEEGDPRSSAFSPLKREDVKNFILNIELLNENATAERLLNMTPGELLDLNNPANRGKAGNYENQTGAELSKIINEGAKQPAQPVEDQAAPQQVQNTGAKSADAIKMKSELVSAAQFAHIRLDARCSTAYFNAIEKAAKETILKKLCPNLSSPSSSLADAVKMYNDIFARNKMTIRFTDDGTMKCDDMNSLAHDFEKLLSALTWDDDILRMALECEISDEDALKVVNDFYEKLNMIPESKA